MGIVPSLSKFICVHGDLVQQSQRVCGEVKVIKCPIYWPKEHREKKPVLKEGARWPRLSAPPKEARV